MRKLLLYAAFAAVAMASPAGAAGIEKPECVAPAKPGGGFDLTCRVAQTGLQKLLKSPMQVSFMPGGIGAVAINVFNTTRTDDSNTIVAFSTGSLLNIATGKFGQWTEKDVRFVATAGADFGAVVVRRDSPYKTLKDLMDKLTEDPGSVVIGAGGSVGSQDWMKAALLLRTVGKNPKDMRYVAYDGGGEAIAGLLGGAIQAYTGDAGEMVWHVNAGTMRILAILSPTRLPAPFADIPTAIEQGYDAEWTILRGFYVGKNVPDAAYNAWVELFRTAHASEDFATVQKDKGILPLNLTGADLDAAIEKQMGTLRGIARDAGLIQ